MAAFFVERSELESPLNRIRQGVCFSLTLLAVVSGALLGARWMEVADPTWVLVSAVVCTEFEYDAARSIAFSRIFSTVIGAAFASLVLWLLGPGTPALLIGTVSIGLVCRSVPRLERNLKLATATGLIVLIAGSQQHSLAFGETVAFQRALDVMAGSLTAGAISLLMSKCWAALGWSGIPSKGLNESR